MELEITEPYTSHPGIASQRLVEARTWDRPPPTLLLDLAAPPRPAVTGLPRSRRVSGRSLDSFQDALLVWSDCFVIGRRFECGYGESALWQAWALGLRDVGSTAQRTSTLSIVAGRPALDDAKLAAARLIEEPVFFATPQEPHNWGLWLTASLPAIARFQARGRAAEKLFVYAHHPNMEAAFDLFGLDRAAILRHDVFAAYRLREVTLYRPGAMDLQTTDEERALFADLARRVLARGAAGSPTPRRIFVSRRARTAQHDAPRTLVNEEALVAGFEAMGFTTIEPLALSLEEQIRHFAGADMVAGAGGAGLFNTVFCRPGTRLLAIEDSPTFLDNHGSLFASMGLEYGFVVGVHDPPAAGAPGQVRWTADTVATLAAARRFFGIGG